MSDYRRWYVPGGTYFFTAVTVGRRPISVLRLARTCLVMLLRLFARNGRWRWLHVVASSRPYPHDLDVASWRLAYPFAGSDSRKSSRSRILRNGGAELPRSHSRQRHGERGVWQRRYWGHMVRDEDDLKRCVDYVHWNPKETRLLNQASAIGLGPRFTDMLHLASMIANGERKTRRQATMIPNGVNGSRRDLVGLRYACPTLLLLLRRS